MSGDSAREAPTALPQPYVMQVPPEDVEAPVPSKIVASRGVVMAETAAERAKRKKDYSSMVKSIVPAAGRSTATASAPR